MSGVSVKLPAVIGALDVLAVEMPHRKRIRPMRADVAQHEDFAGGIAAYGQGHFQARCRDEFLPLKTVAAQDGIPESPEDFGVAAGASDRR